jgi:RNA recognition motif-containing protein
LCNFQAFADYGEIKEANIVFDRETGRSRGFGFVTFAEKSNAETACNQMNQAVRC